MTTRPSDRALSKALEELRENATVSRDVLRAFDWIERRAREIDAKPVEGLLPCPFCGSAAVTLWPPTCEKDSEYNPADRAFPIVRCGCGVEAPGENWDHKGSSAVVAWNRREGRGS